MQALCRATIHSEKGRAYKNSKPRPTGKIKMQTDSANACRKCGATYQPRRCPAVGATCHKCGKQNHFAKMCGTSQNRTDTARSVNHLESEVESLFIGTVSCVGVNGITQQTDKVWYTTANIRDTPVRFKLDTGADVNVLPLTIFQKIPGPAQLEPSHIALVAYGGARLKPKGTVTFTCETSNAKAKLLFFVTTQSSTPILGREDCEVLRLVRRTETFAVKAPATKEELVERYPAFFSGFGQFPGVHHIHTDPSVVPVVHGYLSPSWTG